MLEVIFLLLPHARADSLSNPFCALEPILGRVRGRVNIEHIILIVESFRKIFFLRLETTETSMPKLSTQRLNIMKKRTS